MSTWSPSTRPSAGCTGRADDPARRAIDRAGAGGGGFRDGAAGRQKRLAGRRGRSGPRSAGAERAISAPADIGRAVRIAATSALFYLVVGGGKIGQRHRNGDGFLAKILKRQPQLLARFKRGQHIGSDRGSGI